LSITSPNIDRFLPARRSKPVSGVFAKETCLSVRPSVTAGIVSKRLNLSYFKKEGSTANRSILDRVHITHQHPIV